MVYDGGLDKRSSLDSLQQALFFSVLTGKQPEVVIYDTDGQEGQFEYRIRTACQKAGFDLAVSSRHYAKSPSENLIARGELFGPARVRFCFFFGGKLIHVPYTVHILEIFHIEDAKYERKEN